MKSPVRLASTAYEKVWGSPLTEPWFPNPERRKIGEVWFSASSAVPLLVKFLFTSENLSIQVHPKDDYARERHNCAGKTEMWHVLRAESDAKIALGLRQAISSDRLRAASLSGEIMDLLNWVPARPGDTFFTPAGTIHALGGGLAVCEVQQLSDVTYRLYDYGRPRELHLDDGIAVSDLAPYEGRRMPEPLGAGRELLAECSYFTTERVRVSGSFASPSPARNTLYIVLEGEGTIAGEPFQAGEAWEVAAASEPFEIKSANAILLVTSEPQQGP